MCWLPSDSCDKIPAGSWQGMLLASAENTQCVVALDDCANVMFGQWSYMCKQYMLKCRVMW